MLKQDIVAKAAQALALRLFRPLLATLCANASHSRVLKSANRPDSESAVRSRQSAILTVTCNKLNQIAPNCAFQKNNPENLNLERSPSFPSVRYLPALNPQSPHPRLSAVAAVESAVGPSDFPHPSAVNRTDQQRSAAIRATKIFLAPTADHSSSPRLRDHAYTHSSFACLP